MSTSPKKQKRQEEKTAGDVAHLVVKAALSAIPVAGGPLAEIFAFLITEPITKRRDAWINEIGGRLIELEKKYERTDGKPLIESLKDDESFTTVLLTASQIAVRNHQKEKLEVLRNAVLNAALGILPDDTERAIILDLIDRLTPTHLAVLSLMRDPAANPQVANHFKNISMGGLEHVIHTAFSQLNSELIEIVWRDLYGAALLNTQAFRGMMTGHGLMQRRTTDFGDKFLDFIANPLATPDPA